MVAISAIQVRGKTKDWAPSGEFDETRRREVTPGWPTVGTVENTLSQGQYHQFRLSLEQSPHHNLIHGRVGRDMAQMISPNDPIFFLHHCQVDRIWARWQQDHPEASVLRALRDERDESW